MVKQLDASRLFSQAYKIDLQLGFEPEINVAYKWKVLEEYAKNEFNLVALAMSTDNTSLEATIKYIAEVRAIIQSNPNQYYLVESVEDIKKCKKENKLGLSFLLQGANPIDKNLDMLDIYHALGVRSIIIAYNIRNPYADGCIEEKDAGLSRLGRELVLKMNELGLVIDCSHTGYQSSLEAIELSQFPVIFSHSNVYHLHPHPRNLKDEQIKAVAQNGGVIGINGNAGLLGAKQANIEDFFAHIDYIANLVGPEFVALGTDQVYFPEAFEEYMKKQAIFYSQNYQKGLNISDDSYIKPMQIRELVNLLLVKGYSEQAIRGILGENYLNIIQKVWK
jgi:membrane dipeptidase